ncbi:MAG: RDD family protein [Kofleriaceae bacterium]|nr:RDD family protein [Myxococcales bacterium]MCB9559951.1 RDD family protein [Kofleriaceae bacterium]MCB9571566.1 RDD family protein [Kofleriaceae bacterium]
MSSPATQYLQRVADRRAREIVTPEGVPIRFTLAGPGDRAGAFMLDVLIQAAMIVVLVLVADLLIGSAGEDSWAASLFIVAAFVLRTFYFVFFETRWQGATPGKRIVGIRVIDGRGGQLEPGSILARNLVREVEVWLPLTLLVAGAQVWPGAPGWARLLAAAWVLVLLLMPMFNKDHLRVGDMIGGTMVVMQPKTVLAPDLADAATHAPQLPAWGGKPATAAPRFPFTTAHLDVYGIYELQVLEGVLRTEAVTVAHAEAVAAVAEKIHAKIDYDQLVPTHEQERFLRDFYTALRAHLEKKMLFGQRREDKYSKK